MNTENTTMTQAHTELRALAEAAEKDGQHIFTNPRDSNAWKANEAWHKAASPEVVIALLNQIAEPAAPVKQIDDAIDSLLRAALVEGGCSAERVIEARDATNQRRAELRALLSSAQSGEQVPFMYAIADGYGNAFFEEQGCVSSEAKDLQPEVDGLNENLDGEPPYKVVAVYTHPAQLSAVQTTKVVEALEMLENGALNVAENAKNRGDDYGVGYAQAMAKMARDTLDVLSAPAHPAEGVPVQAVLDGGTPGPWRVRKRTNDAGEVLDCFVTAPDCQGRAYDAHILGDDYDSIELKLADAELIVAAVNAYRALAATHPTQQGLDAQELLAALGDLSFACFGGIGTKAPDAATYNRTFAVLQKHRDAAQAKQGGE